MNITKIVFIPTRISPTKCKNIEYFVETENWKEAMEKASKQLKQDNELWSYYQDTVATTIKVL